MTKNNCECYGITFRNNGWIEVHISEDISSDKNEIYRVKPLEIFSGKSQVCEMTMFSGAFDKSLFDGNTILLKVSEECNRHRYVYIGGDMLYSFLTNDNNYKYVSNMGNNLTLYSVAVGHENICFLTPHFKFIEREKINDDDLLKTNENSVDPYDYHLSKCGKDPFKKLRLYKIPSNYE